MPRTTPAPLPYRAKASHQHSLIADSLAAVRVDVPDDAPLLWFPPGDVDHDALRTLDAGQWRSGVGDLDGYIAFDHEKIELTLIDGGEGDDERDVTVKRFPTWGDAAELIELLDVRPEAEGRFISHPRDDWRRPVVEGSQILGQAIVAAGRQAPGRRAVSASMVFTRAADARLPYAIELERVASGRTFSGFATRATQGEKVCAFGSLLLDVTAPDVIRHAEPPSTMAGPYESAPYDMSVTGRDVRIVDDAYTGDPAAPVGPPELHAWVRFREVPDDQPLHAGLLAQFTGHLSIAAALRPHPGIGQDQAHHTLSTAINAISLSIHTDVRADHWLSYSHRSTFAGDGMTHADCRVHDLDGHLVASFTVDAMVRAIADSSKPLDRKTAL